MTKFLPKSNKPSPIIWSRWYALVAIPLFSSIFISIGIIGIQDVQIAKANPIPNIGNNAKPRILAVSFPTYEVARMVTGTKHVQLETLVPFNQDPLQYTITTEDIVRIQRADMIITLDAYMGSINEQLSGINSEAIAALPAYSEGALNWLNVDYMRANLDSMLQAFSADGALYQSQFELNHARSVSELNRLGDELIATATKCGNVRMLSGGSFVFPYIKTQSIPDEFTLFQQMRNINNYAIIEHTQIGNVASRIPSGIERIRSYHTMTQVYDHKEGTTYFTLARQNNSMLRSLCG